MSARSQQRESERLEIAKAIVGSQQGPPRSYIEEKVMQLAATAVIHPIWPMVLVEPTDMKLRDEITAPGGMIVAPEAAEMNCRYREGVVLELPVAKLPNGDAYPWLYHEGDRIVFEKFYGMPVTKFGRQMELIPVQKIIPHIKENPVQILEPTPETTETKPA